MNMNCIFFIGNAADGMREITGWWLELPFRAIYFCLAFAEYWRHELISGNW
jgi:hypothetical protein